jgi:hypothetical protein
MRQSCSTRLRQVFSATMAHCSFWSVRQSRFGTLTHVRLGRGVQT